MINIFHADAQKTGLDEDSIDDEITKSVATVNVFNEPSSKKMAMNYPAASVNQYQLKKPADKTEPSPRYVRDPIRVEQPNMQRVKTADNVGKRQHRYCAGKDHRAIMPEDLMQGS